MLDARELARVAGEQARVAAVAGGASGSAPVAPPASPAATQAPAVAAHVPGVRCRRRRPAPAVPGSSGGDLAPSRGAAACTRPARGRGR